MKYIMFFCFLFINNVAIASDGHYMAFGLGLLGCSEVYREDRTTLDKNIINSYISGYLTAISLIVKDVVVFERNESESGKDWIKDQCDRFPSSYFSEAISDYVAFKIKNKMELKAKDESEK